MSGIGKLARKSTKLRDSMLKSGVLGAIVSMIEHKDSSVGLVLAGCKAVEGMCEKLYCTISLF